MSSIDRLHKFAELLCRAIPDLDPGSISPRPLDTASTFHVGRLLTKAGGLRGVRVLFAVSEASDFVPMAFVTTEDNAVGVTLEFVSQYVANNPAPPVGFTFSIENVSGLSELGAAGGVLLNPAMLEALSAFKETLTENGDSFDARLVVYLDKADLAMAIADVPALMKKFGESGRSVILGRDDF